MKKGALFAVLAILTLALDHLSKWWATSRLYKQAPIVYLRDYFQLQYAENRGVAFSLMSGDEPWRRWVLIGIGMVALGFVAYLVAKAAESQKRLVAGLALIAGGAIGNLIDRAWHGYVVDFIVVHYHEHRWPTFNIADAALVVGVGLLFLDMAKPQHVEAADEAAEKPRPARKKAR